MMVNNEVPTDTGDGIMHFFISQASWNNPSLFLDHWGKPLFILLSSPFAQFGFNGMVAFNILVFLLTVLLSNYIFFKQKTSAWISLLFPLVLLKTYDVSSTVLGGLTEPLFNLALVAALYLLLERKYLWFALLVSFLPFMRSEGQLPIVLAFSILILLKEYKSLPFLSTGFLIYGLIGLPVYGDFLWYFTKSPYQMDNGIYGSGPWYHYLISYESYIGKFGLLVAISGLISLIYLFLKRKWNAINWQGLIFTYGVFFGVLFVHSYFWATGQSGSLGLTRIATQGMPVFLLVNLIYIGKTPLNNLFIVNGIFTAVASVLIFLLVNTYYFPKKADPLEKEVIDAAEFLKAANLKGNKIYYHFPLFAYAYGENGLIKNTPIVHHSFAHLEDDIQQLLKPGDIIVRDSHFGPQEMHLPLKELENRQEFVKIKEFTSAEQVTDTYNEIEGVTIYQYIPTSLQKHRIIPKAKLILAVKEFQIGSMDEFTPIQTLFPQVSEKSKISFVLTSCTDGFKLVYDVNNGEKYVATDLHTQKSFNGSYLFEYGEETKLYIWNPTKTSGKVSIEQVTSQKVVEYPLLRQR
jgi:hypothetical protein